MKDIMPVIAKPEDPNERVRERIGVPSFWGMVSKASPSYSRVCQYLWLVR